MLTKGKENAGEKITMDATLKSLTVDRAKATLAMHLSAPSTPTTTISLKCVASGAIVYISSKGFLYFLHWPPKLRLLLFFFSLLLIDCSIGLEGSQSSGGRKLGDAEKKVKRASRIRTDNGASEAHYCRLQLSSKAVICVLSRQWTDRKRDEIQLDR